MAAGLLVAAIEAAVCCTGALRGCEGEQEYGARVAVIGWSEREDVVGGGGGGEWEECWSDRRCLSDGDGALLVGAVLVGVVLDCGRVSEEVFG